MSPTAPRHRSRLLGAAAPPLVMTARDKGLPVRAQPVFVH